MDGFTCHLRAYVYAHLCLVVRLAEYAYQHASAYIRSVRVARRTNHLLRQARPLRSPRLLRHMTNPIGIQGVWAQTYVCALGVGGDDGDDDDLIGELL